MILPFLSAGIASADDAAPAPEPPQELKEIVVTAQKTRQTLEQVPASVTSIDGDFIREVGARNFVELQNYAANTNIELSPSSGQFLIRGLGSLNDVQGLDPSVGTVVDGVPYTYANYLSAFFTDLDHFEVLRGPQGTLFGKNTSAGLLNVLTNAPSDELLFKSDITARSYGDRSFQPVINLPIGDDLALRFAGNFEHGDHGVLYNDYLDRPEANPNQDTGRLRLRYDTHQGWTVDLGAFASFQQQNFNVYQLIRVSPAMTALDRFYDPKFESNFDNVTSANVPSTEKSSLRGGNLTVEGDLGHQMGLESLKVTSITGIAENVITARDLDGDFSPVPFILDTLVYPEPERQVTQEIRMAGKGASLFGVGGPVNFVTSLYYDNYTLKTSDNFQIQSLGATLAYLLAARDPNGSGQLGGPLGSSIDELITLLQGPLGSSFLQQSAKSGLSQRTQDYAYFGQFEWSIFRDWSFIGGLRYGKENRKAVAFSASSSEIIKAVAKQQDFNEQVSRNEGDFSPKAGIKWQLSKRSEAYFTWARGYKSGGFNGIPLNPDTLEFGPERTTSYEIGFKLRGHLLGGPIRLSTSAFETELKNLQVSTFQGTNVVVVNAAAARSQGFENDVQWLLPVRGLSLYSSFGYADAHYSRYPNGQETGDGHCAGDQTPQGCDLTGKRLPFAPRWTASVVPAYTLHLPYALASTVAVDVLYQGSRYLNSEDDVRELQQSTTQFNTRLVLADDARGDWSVTLSANNLTHELIADQILDQPLAPGNFAAIRIDRGRYYTANLTVSLH